MSSGAHTPCGIAIPQFFIDRPTDMELVRTCVRRAEALGYDSLWTQEQIIGDVPILEPLTLLSYVAALTSKLRLGVSVMVTPVRNPLQLAKSLSSLDQMSGGRLTVGVGVGATPQEATFGYDSQHRVRRFVEGLQVMKALWTSPRATVTGTFWQFQNVAMEPKPLQKPHPPLWFGGREAPALKRAVQHGDGWMGAGGSSSSDFVKHVGLVRRFLDEAGRDPATFPISKRVYIAVDNDRARAERRLRAWFGPAYGSADLASAVSVYGNRAECVDRLGEVVKAGAQHLMLNPVVDELEHVDLLGRDIVPYV